MKRDQFMKDRFFFILLAFTGVIAFIAYLFGELSLLGYFGLIVEACGICLKWTKSRMFETWPKENLTPENVGFITRCILVMQVLGAILIAVDFI